MSIKIIMTDGTKTETIYRIKSDPMRDETPGVWTSNQSKFAEQAQSSLLVPSVFAGITARMQAMADLPFLIYRKGKEVDNSDNYQNAIKILPDPYSFFAHCEGSLVCAGANYWYKNRGENSGQVKSLQYWIPTSVKIDAALAAKGEIAFRRTGQPGLFPAENVMYTWLIDPYVELGPPNIYPLASALDAAKANGAITRWIADYMNRGAVKAMLLMVDGMPDKAEVDRMETWFNRLMSSARGIVWKVFNATGVKPTVVGEGLDALKDLSVSRDLRYDIHTALGTRHLLEDENFATAKARERQFYQMTIVPDARLLQASINTQLLEPLGYHLEFEPQRLESFQEDEAEQASSFGTLLEIFMRGLPFDVAFSLASQKLDYPFTDEELALIRREYQANEQRKQEHPQVIRSTAFAELERWKAKSDKAGKVSKWHTSTIPTEITDKIENGEITFDEAKTAMQAWNTGIPDIASAINNAVKLLKNGNK